jgi:hypothetical protein
MDILNLAHMVSAFQVSYKLSYTRLMWAMVFVPYVLLGGLMTADKVFFTMALYCMLSYSVAAMLPYGLTMAGKARMSLKRIHVRY